jgi:parvulin-like peptidyl-prolyl isomerase
MVEEKDVEMPNDESNIDQINQFVTSSEDVKEAEVQKPEAVEESKVEEKEETPKKEHKEHLEHKHKKKEPEDKKIESEHKKSEPEHKPVHHIKHDKPEVKKVEYKKAEPKHEKTEHKSKPATKPEPKKNVKEKSKAKKIFSLGKPSKEEKMTNHKEHTEHKKKFKFTKNTLLWIGIGILALVLVIALILILLPGKSQPTIGNETSKGVAATVNGEPIYLKDVLKDYNNINPLIKSMYSVESVLNKSIDDMLLYQEAKNLGIVIKPELVQSEIDKIKEQNKLTDETLAKALEAQGLTLDDAKLLIEKNLMVRQMLDDRILQNITITEGQIEKYYLINLDKFRIPEKVTVQHILILTGPNVTDNESKAKIEKVQKELNATNFCDLVTKYSEDQSSISNCGKYTFERGKMVPEFENPSFDMNIGETTIVKTQFGYHLIKKLESFPARTMNLSEAASQINITLHDDAAQAKFEAIIVDLRAKALIINYMTKTNTNESKTSVLTERIAADTTPVVKNLDDFAKCITEKGAIFYGASWCEHCNNQKKTFGDSMQYVKYVECAVEGQPQVQTPECTTAGISGYPTWKINGQSYPGEQAMGDLARLTGCTLPQ